MGRTAMDLFEQFKARAEAVQAEVHRFPSFTEAVRFLRDFLKSEGGTAVWAGEPLFDGQDLHARATRELSASAHVGISRMDWGAAATGTLLQDATAADQRLASTLPLIHIAVLPTCRIVPDIAAALAKFTPAQSPYISMITGPSRTADIERVLTIGVHGPERLIILCVDDMEGAAR